MDSTLHQNALRLVSKGKGILAADQSPNSMNKLLESFNIAPEAEVRRSYRQLLFTTEGIEKYVTGVIMHDGTIRNHTDDGVQFSDLLIAKGIIPIIKVDTGTVPHTNFPGEVVTQGLDGLAERLREYFDMGARAAKWRAVVTIGEAIPTMQNLRADAFTLARYAALCQEAGIVPMIEPEVLFAGNHDLARAEAVTTQALRVVFEALEEQKVDCRGVLLKSSMVLAGSDHPNATSPEEVAEATLRTFKNSVPEDVPGIVFLSGGQSTQRATENLNAIAQYEQEHAEIPWEFAFSFSRAIEEPVLTVWKGKPENKQAAQEALLTRLRLNSLADMGEYEKGMESS
jgi:fructose-bisphosphate aldolase class I